MQQNPTQELTFKGAARRLSDTDLAKIAHTLGVSEDELHAVLEVETRGGGFDKHGRVKMLFEPHVFYRELSGSKRQAAIAAGLAYRRFGESPYPADSYPRLKAAMLIDVEAALRACSWGLGQIMGFNHLLAGYSSALKMVQAFVDDENTQLAAMSEFIISQGLDDNLRNLDWRGFAQGYNGSSYEKYGYHTKLKKAYEKWKKIPNTPFEMDRTPIAKNPPQTPEYETRAVLLKLGARGGDVKILQSVLLELGYPVGNIDGHFGDLTKRAVVSFQAKHGLEPDGVVGDTTWEKLTLTKPLPEREVTEEDLRERGSSTIANADRGRKLLNRTEGTLGTLVSAGTVAELAKSASEAEGALEIGQRLLTEYWALLLVVGFVFLITRYGKRLLAQVVKTRVSDARSRKNLGR